MTTIKVSSKGQIVIPVEMRRQLHIDENRELTATLEDDKIVLQVLPAADEWADLFKDIPVEEVDVDENGHYDPEKSPNFHDWMQEDY